MLEHWFADPAKVGATVLLMAAVVAYHKGWIVARWYFDRYSADKEAEIERVRKECSYEREARERLLAQLERTVRIAEVTSEAAITTKGKL